MATNAQTPPPGAGVLTRDEEWIIRFVEPCDMGGHQLACLGVSETVRNRDAVFLTELDPVRVLDPQDTELALTEDGAEPFTAANWTVIHAASDEAIETLLKETQQ